MHAGVQTPGVLDDLFFYDGPLGPQINLQGVKLHLWAPTAHQVLYLHENPFTKPFPSLFQRRLSTDCASQHGADISSSDLFMQLHMAAVSCAYCVELHLHQLMARLCCAVIAFATWQLAQPVRQLHMLADETPSKTCCYMEQWPGC